MKRLFELPQLLFKIVFLVLVLWFSEPGVAGTYYVAVNGNDQGEGSFSSPWRTVAFAVDQTSAGDTILVRGGTYRESLVWFRTNRRRRQSRQWHDWRRNRGMHRDPTIPRGGSPRDRHMYEAGDPTKVWVLKAYPGEEVIMENDRPVRIQAPYVRVEGIHFKGTGVGVVNINRGGGHHVEIVGNYFTGSGYRYGAISVSGDSILIEGNILEIEDQPGTQDHGIYLQQGRGNIIRNNFISGATGYGIHLFCEQKGRRDAGGSFVIANALVENNVITNSRLRSGMIVATGRGNTLAKDIVIRNNIIYKNKGNGIDLRRTINGLEIYNNTIYDNGLDGITLGFVAKRGGSVENVTIKNNIIQISNRKQHHINSNPDVVVSNTVTVDHNLFWPGPAAVAELKASNNVIANPKFADAARLDFLLSNNSPARDAGVDVGAAFRGKAPDLGAVELGAPKLADVHLNGLHAAAVGDVVNLNWRTVAEYLKVGFEVERSDAKHKEDYHKIGFVEGHGPKIAVQGYDFVDEGVPQGTYYYRLKKIDSNGNFAYTKSIKVKVKASEANSSKEKVTNGL